MTHEDFITDRLYSTAVSRLRQPVESLFNWIQEKTGIECASKVRSFRGLLVHVFARLAAALFLLNERSLSTYSHFNIALDER
jgi:hypothetical protein